MTQSTLTLATARTAMLRQLYEAAAGLFPNDQLDQGLRLAIAEYGAVKPRRMYWEGTTAAAGSTRFIQMWNMNFLYQGGVIREFWANYDAAQGWPLGMNGAHQVKFNVISDGVSVPGTPTLELEEYVQTDTATAKWVVLFDFPVRQLTDLDGAASTTWMVEADHWVVMGACAHAAMMRGLDLGEDVAAGVVTSVGGGAVASAGGQPGRTRVLTTGAAIYAAMSGKTGNYGAISMTWLNQFRAWMADPIKPRGHFFRERERTTRYLGYDAALLG